MLCIPTPQQCRKILCSTGFHSPINLSIDRARLQSIADHWDGCAILWFPREYLEQYSNPETTRLSQRQLHALNSPRMETMLRKFQRRISNVNFPAVLIRKNYRNSKDCIHNCSLSRRNLATRSRSAPSAPLRRPARYETIQDRLARKGGQTLLYQSASSVPYILGCYAVGGTFIAIGYFNAQTNRLVSRHTSSSGDSKKNSYASRIPLLSDNALTLIYVGSAFIMLGGAYFCSKVCDPLSTNSADLQAAKSRQDNHFRPR